MVREGLGPQDPNPMPFHIPFFPFLTKMVPLPRTARDNPLKDVNESTVR